MSVPYHAGHLSADNPMSAKGKWRSSEGYWWHDDGTGWKRMSPSNGTKVEAPADALIGEALSKTPVEKTSGYVPDKFSADDVGSVLEEMWRS